MESINWKRNLVFIFVSQFLAMAGFGCCMPFIPLLLRDNLHVDSDQLRGLYMSIYYMTGMLSLTIAYPIWGTLADKFGRKIMLLRASYVAGLCYPLLAFAGNYWILLTIRFFTSFFSGTVNPAQTLLLTTTPKERHGFCLGLLSTAIWSGDMAGYLLGGIMVDHFGYKVAFLSCGAVYLLSGILVHLFVGEHFVRPTATTAPAKQKREGLRSLMTPGVFWLMALFLLMGLSRRMDMPFVAMLVEIVNGVKKAATYTGYTSAAAALGGVVAGLLVGHLCDRFAPRKLLLPILLVSATFTLGQAFSTSIRCLMLCRFLTYMAAGGLQPVLQVMITKITAPEKRGSYLGWTASINSAGGILCNLISGPVVYYVGVRGVFTAAALIFFLMIPMLLPAPRAYNKELQPQHA